MDDGSHGRVKGKRATERGVTFKRFQPASLPVPLAEQPVGPPLMGREGLEFMVAMANLSLAQLGQLKTTGELRARDDLDHVESVCYRLCRFLQASNSYFERLRASAYRDPAGTLEPRLAPLKALVGALADGVNLECSLGRGIKNRDFWPGTT